MIKRKVKITHTVKDVPETCISEFRVRALEKSYSCTCGGKLVLVRKTGLNQKFVCQKCRKYWVMDFVKRCITEGGD